MRSSFPAQVSLGLEQPMVTRGPLHRARLQGPRMLDYGSSPSAVLPPSSASHNLYVMAWLKAFLSSLFHLSTLSFHLMACHNTILLFVFFLISNSCFRGYLVLAFREFFWLIYTHTYSSILYIISAIHTFYFPHTQWSNVLQVLSQACHFTWFLLVVLLCFCYPYNTIATVFFFLCELFCACVDPGDQ
jgi:hypothetical protein